MKYVRTNKVAIKNKPSHNIFNDVCDLVLEPAGMYHVTDEWYNNSNDLRRAIQYYIDTHKLPMRVFMVQGETYVEVLK